MFIIRTEQRQKRFANKLWEKIELKNNAYKRQIKYYNFGYKRERKKRRKNYDEQHSILHIYNNTNS